MTSKSALQKSWIRQAANSVLSCHVMNCSVIQAVVDRVGTNLHLIFPKVTSAWLIVTPVLRDC